MTKHHFLGLCVLLLCMASCNKTDYKQPEFWRQGIDKASKKPYGTYLAHQMVPQLVSHSKFTTLQEQYQFTQLKTTSVDSNHLPSLLFIVSEKIEFTKAEWSHLEDFVIKGNQLVLFTTDLDADVAERMSISINDNNNDHSKPTYIKNEYPLTLKNTPDRHYGYHGKYFNKELINYLDDSLHSDNASDTTETSDESTDTSATQTVIDTNDEAYYNGKLIYYIDTVGYNNNATNALLLHFGKGQILVHSNPNVLSNYFLLQPNNLQYVQELLSSLPNQYDQLYWYDCNYRYRKELSLSDLLEYPPLRWAFYLAMLLCIMYVLIHLKRAQRILPIVPPLRNDSVSFVETVGRLYYNQGNHQNLAEKLSMQFLDWVRTHYHLNTNQLNADFCKTLAAKSGIDEATLEELVACIGEIRLQAVPITDAYLYKVYSLIQKCYKNKPQ